MKQISHPEHGNILLYILVAVALLAALSYAVSQSNRGSVKTLSDERARLMAAELLEYANIMASGVAQLRLRGVTEASLCFDDPSWPAGLDYDHGGCATETNKIFSPSGAGLIWAAAPSDAMDSTATPDNLWHIYGDNEVSQVGTTCGTASCADLLLVVNELNAAVCQQINKLLGIADLEDTPPTDAALGTTRYIGAFGYTATLGEEVGGSVFRGKNAACFQKTGGGVNYVFYKVLIAR